MYWGAGPELGLLTVLGYLCFLAGIVSVWRGRDDASLWLHTEALVLRRNLSRHTAIGPFYSPREESRVKVLPRAFIGSLSRMPRFLLYRSAVLLLIAPVLVLLDFIF